MSNLVPDGWHEIKSGDIFDFNNGKAFYSDGYSESGYRVIDLLNIDLSGKFQLTAKDKFVSENVYQKYPKAHLHENDLIIIMTDITPTLGLIGKTAIIDKSEQYVLNQRVGCLRSKSELLSIKFMNYMFNSDVIRLQVVKNTLGTAQFYVNTHVFKQLDIPFPPFPEQQKIAKILTSVDEVIEKTQAQIDKLKDLKTGMMQELLTNGIGHTEFKDSPVGRIPAEWTYSELGKLVTFSQGVQVDLELQKTEFFEGGVPFLRIENYTQNSKDLRYIDASSARDKYTKKEDVVMVRYGATAGFVGRGAEGVLANNLFQVKPNNTLLTKDFLHLFLLQSFEKLQMMMAGGAMPALNFSMVSGLSLALPPIKEQQDIANAIYSIDKLGEATRKKLKHIQNTKKALMQDLLTGKVRVNV